MATPALFLSPPPSNTPSGSIKIHIFKEKREVKNDYLTRIINDVEATHLECYC